MKRKPTYLSNSALKTWETDRREYYLRYLTDRVPKTLQTAPMAIGSAFDGMVKNVIEKMLGLPIKDYTRQVEGGIDTPVYQEAMKEGARVLDFYRAASGINRLLVTGVPRMEFSVQCAVPGTENCIGGPVILLGKPDLYYRVSGQKIVHDWKVNGYYSKASPQKGYVWDSKTRSHHKDIFPKKVGELSVGLTSNFSPDWLDQLTGYGWCLGEPIGEGFVLQIHQITNAGPGVGEALRLTEHRVLADPAHQRSLRDRLVGCWEAINSGRVFTDLSLEEDILEQAHCDRIAAGMQDSVFNLVCGR